MTSLSPLSALSGLSSLGGNNATGTGEAQSAGASTASGSGPAWLSGELPKIVIILLGLILIIAGLFSFRGVRETVVIAGKTGAKAAGTAAAVAA